MKKQYLAKVVLFVSFKILKSFIKSQKCTYLIIQKLGPGQYNINGLLNQRGNYFESKHRGSGCGKIGK